MIMTEIRVDLTGDLMKGINKGITEAVQDLYDSNEVDSPEMQLLNHTGSSLNEKPTDMLDGYFTQKI